MSQYVAIHEDGIIAIECEEVVDAYGQIEFYGIKKVQYNIDLNRESGRIFHNIQDLDDNDDTLIVGKHDKFENRAIDVIPDNREMHQSIIYFLFMW